MTGAARLLVIGDYRRTWLIGVVGGIARWLEFVALAIYTYDTTRSPELVAMLGLLRMAPYMACGVLMGALADALDRRVILMASLLLMAAVSAVFAGIALAGSLTFAWVAVFMLISGLYWTTDMPVRRRLMVDASPDEEIASALGLDNACMYAARALGPIIGGATYQFVGVTGIFIIICLSYLACAALAFAITARRERTAAGQALTLIQRLVPPARLFADRRFLIVLGVTMVFNLWCFPFVTMVPVIAQKDFLMTPAVVGAFAALEGIGGIAGALLVGALARQQTLFRFYYCGVVGFLVVMLMMAATLSPLATGVLLPFIGIASAAFSATQYALVHVSVPSEIRGRAAGVLSVFIGTAMIGHYLAGKLFEDYGTVSATMTMSLLGLVMIVPLGIAWVLAPPPPAAEKPLNPRP